MALLRLGGVCFPLLPALVTLGAAAVHQADFGADTYVRSPLVGVEIVGMMLGLLALVAQLPVHVIFAVGRRWGWLAAGLGGAVLAAVLIVAAMVVDAPTLVYLT